MTDNDFSNEESFAELFSQSDTKQKKLTPGQKVTARVTGMAKEYVFLDVGGKSEGYLDINELKDADGNVTVQPGANVEAYFLSAANNELLFTTRIGHGPASGAHLKEAYANGIPVEGLVSQEIKGGFEVTVSGTRSFCPYSQIDLRRQEDTAKYIGEKFAFKITEYDEKKNNVVLSRRAVLEEEREEQKLALQETLQEGMTVRGKISSIRDFGAFIDLGGMDGLIPISEIGWSRVESVHDELSIGQEVEAVVLKIDWEKDRISLSLKQSLPDPWHDAAKKFPAGSTHTGTVIRLVDFGAFVNLAPGLDGLIHISKLGGGRRINHPREAIAEGQALTVYIEGVDLEKKRISLKLVTDAGQEEAADDPEKDFQEFSQQSVGGNKNKSMGTLGDLLQTTLKKKK